MVKKKSKLCRERKKEGVADSSNRRGKLEKKASSLAPYGLRASQDSWKKASRFPFACPRL